MWKMLNVSYFHYNVFSVNTWILWDEESNAVIVDPGCATDVERNSLLEFIREKSLRPQCILVTHGHGDHVAGVGFISSRLSIPVYMSQKEMDVMEEHLEVIEKYGLRKYYEPFPIIDVVDGQVMKLLGRDWQVIETPGHSPGGLCWYCAQEEMLISGDTLFKGTIGRTDLPCCNYDELIVSIMEKIMGLPGSTNVLPGHGPTTTIAQERTSNPFLEPFNEPDQDYQ